MRLAVIALAGLLVAACSPAAPSADPAPDSAAAMAPIVPAGDRPTDAELEAGIASVNPLENDLRGLEMALRLPDAFEVKADGAVLNLQVVSDTDGLVIDEKFVLAEAQIPDAVFAAPLAASGFTVHWFRLSPADHDRMADTQARMMAIREASPGQNELSFDTGAATCVSAGQAPPEVYRYSVYLRSAPTVSFVSLGGDMDIARATAGALSPLWDPCPA